MPSDSSLIERQMAEVELRPFTLDDFHRRRHQRQRNRRIATGALGLALAAVVAGGVLQSLNTDDEKVESDILGPMPSPFAGDWVSTDTDGSSQTMVILRTDGDEHEVVIRDDAATACSGAPATVTGSGQLTSITELVFPRPEVTCDDGSTATSPEGQPLEEVLTDITFVHDPETDELTDRFEVVWRREGLAPAPPDGGGPIVQGASPFEGTWVVGRAGQYFPDSLEIRIVGDEDLHEAVSLKAETPQCAGGPSTMGGTGRREIDQDQSPGLVRLVVTVTLTCDDGSTPIPQSPEEEVILNEFGVSYIHDPVTDELIGSLGSVFIREGGELAQGDPMVTVERMIDAVNAQDTDAFIDLFAPDGGFDVRGGFEDNGFASWQPVAGAHLVQAWMAIQEAWDFEAEVRTCTDDPAVPLEYGAESDAWIECDVAVRWPKLSLEITDRWRFELRGERLLYWEPTPLDLDPIGRALALGYPDLEAWEAWLTANHPEDAARWLNPRGQPSADCCEDADDPELQAALESVLLDAQRSFAIDGQRFAPSGLIPFDPAFADDIEASINEYLEEQ